MTSAFETLDEAWVVLLDELLMSKRHESRLGGSYELLGHSFKITPKNNVLLNPRRAISPAYASAELLWYLSRTDRVEMLLPYAPQYANFAEDDGRAHGAYGHRIARLGPEDQYDLALQLLRQAPGTRQCIIQLWSPRDLWYTVEHPKRDIPCTVCWQFLLRDNELHMIAFMRSNDAWLGTPYDVYCFTSFQKLIAGDLGVEVGTYTHIVGSMHLYDKNVQAAGEALKHYPSFKYGDGYDGGQITTGLDTFISFVRELDEREPLWTMYPAWSSLLADSVACCAQEHGYNLPIVSPALKCAVNNWRNRDHHRRD